MVAYALRLENNTDTAARVRMSHLLGLPAGAQPLTSFSGLRPDGGGAVTVLAGTMNVRVAPFIAWIQGGVSVVQGGYPFVSDANLDLAISAGHASLARIDTVVGVVRDNPFDSSGQVLAAVQVVTGTPGSGAPALPANCVALRNINVPAGTSAGSGGLSSSNLGTDRRVYLDPNIKTLDAATGTASVESGNAGPAVMPGLTRTVQITSTANVLYITLDLDISTAGSAIFSIRPRIDGTNLGPDFVFNFSGRAPFSHTWRVTGLTPGARVVTATVAWGAGGKVDIVGTTSNLIVEQRAA